MTEIFFEMPLKSSQKIEAPAIPLQTSGLVATPPKAVAQSDAAIPRTFCDDEWNSRLNRGVSAVRWPAKWETPLNGTYPPSSVSRSADRILLEGGGQWQLFDRGGKFLAAQPIKHGMALMDSAHSVFYAVDQAGAVTAYNLSDGKKAWSTSLAYGEVFALRYLARVGNRLIMVSVEQEAFPHRKTPPNRSVIQTKELSEPLRVSPGGDLLSVRDAGSLRAETAKVALAMHGSTIAFAVTDRLYFLDLNLKVLAAMETGIEPVMLSLDETGRAYLIGKNAAQYALWSITPQGQRAFAYDIPAEFGMPLMPPIVGYDHRVYLSLPGRIVALSPDGKVAWEQGVSGPATISADDQLLVSSGSLLLAFDQKGNRRVIRDFEGDVLKTAAITTGEGDILVASATKLYRLTPLPR